MWRVRAVKREGFEGFRRGGIFFRSDTWQTLTDEQMTPGIKNEPMLVVEPADKKTGLAALETAAQDVETLQAALGEAQRTIEERGLQLAGKDAEIAVLTGRIAGLEADVKRLTQQLSPGVEEIDALPDSD